MVTVYSTVPREEVEPIASALVEEHLAACVNAVDCRSIYRWEDEVHDDEEAILLCKTVEEEYPKLVDRLEELHPYDVPCIERYDETDVLEAFAEWRADALLR